MITEMRIINMMKMMTQKILMIMTITQFYFVIYCDGFRSMLAGVMVMMIMAITQFWQNLPKKSSLCGTVFSPHRCNLSTLLVWA